MRITVLLAFYLLFTRLSFAQTDYKTSIKNKDGYTCIYTVTYTKPASAYSNSTAVYRYGLLDEKTKKIVLPIQYKTVYTSYEDEIYIVQDSLERFGLYAAKKQKFIIEPTYSKIDGFSEGIAVVQKKKYTNGWNEYAYGAIDKNGKVAIADTFSFLGNCRDGLLNFKQDKQYGYMNKEGKVVIPASYYSAESFVNGLAPVQVNDGDLYGYINKDNKYVIQPKYVYAEIFYEGYANVYKNKKFFTSKATNGGKKNEIGVIDIKGNEVIQPIYEYVSLKKPGGIFVVTKDEKQGLVDSTGKIILPADNKSIGEFNGGIAKIEKTVGMYGLVDTKGKWLLPADYTELSGLYSNAGFYAKKDGKYIVYDNKMKIIIPADTARRIIVGKKNIGYIFENSVKVFDLNGKLIKTINQENVDQYGTNFFSNDDSLKVSFFKQIYLRDLQTKLNQKLNADDIIDFNDEGIFLTKNASKHSFYDYTGKKLFKQSFENVINFSEGICALQENTYSRPYLADKNFLKIKELDKVFYGPFSEGLAKAKSQYGSTIYYLDKQGNTVFYIDAKDGGICKDGRIMIQDNNGKYYYVNKNGSPINSSKYDVLGNFSEGLAGFKDNKKCGYIDISGNIVIYAQFDEVSDFYNGTAIVKQDNNFFLIDKKGKAINNEKYTAAGNPANGTFPVKKGSNFGLIDSKGNTLVAFKYQEISPASEGMLWAKKGEKWALLNTAGKELTAFEYDGFFSFENGYCKTYKDNKIGLIDKTGKIVLSTEYTNIGQVYNNTVITIRNNGSTNYAIK
ncbi:MAG: WG repeat-containing protein [Chitinophagales bacterium]